MTAPHPLERSFAAFLFDMDGTLLDSTAVANRVWRDWAEGHGLDAEQVIAVLHGVRVRDTVRRFANGKPAPDCFIAAAKALGVEIHDCLVWEDAPAGIAAGEAAEATVIVVEATHADPDNAGRLRVPDFRGLSCSVERNGTLRLHGAG